MKAEVYQLKMVGSKPQDTMLGSIILENGVLRAEPSDLSVLRNIMEAPVFVDGRDLRPEDDPEQWIASLCRQYRSPYLRVTAVQ